MVKSSSDSEEEAVATVERTKVAAKTMKLRPYIYFSENKLTQKVDGAGLVPFLQE